MSENTIVIVLGAMGFIFGLLGFIAAAVSAVIVIGWKNSTHKIQYEPIMQPETRTELDIPPHIRDQLPSDPSIETIEQYYRKQQQLAASADSLYEQDIG